MLNDIRKERKIRQTLAGLARQRVALTLQPGNVTVIERALSRDQDTEAALQTCLMRGWVEILYDRTPVGELNLDDLSRPQAFTRTEPVYRLTEGGWSALNRVHAWALVGVVIAILTLAATLFAAI